MNIVIEKVAFHHWDMNGIGLRMLHFFWFAAANDYNLSITRFCDYFVPAKRVCSTNGKCFCSIISTTKESMLAEPSVMHKLSQQTNLTCACTFDSVPKHQHVARSIIGDTAGPSAPLDHSMYDTPTHHSAINRSNHWSYVAQNLGTPVRHVVTSNSNSTSWRGQP